MNFSYPTSAGAGWNGKDAPRADQRERSFFGLSSSLLTAKGELTVRRPFRVAHHVVAALLAPVQGFQRDEDRQKRGEDR